jgi:hypothetical protein
MCSWSSTCRINKSGIEKLHELLRQIVEHCLNGDEIPNDWKIGHISPIYKKEIKTNMKTTEEIVYWIFLVDC